VAEARSRLEPFLLGWGVTYVGVLAGQLILEWREGALLGPWSALYALAVAAVVGSLAGALLGGRLEPPDRRGGAWVLAIAVVALTAAAWLRPPDLPPGEFWGAVPHLLTRRAVWAAILAGATALTLLPRLALKDDEPFEYGRLRRAMAFWLAAGVPPVVALILIRPFPFGLDLWWWALLVPHGLVLGTLGVRLEETRFHGRDARARLAAVSWCSTVLLLCGGFVREMLA
jgi:hypothetical protein